jgi:hypothetical protein
MATAGDRDQRCDGPVSTDRTETGDHTGMFASARKVSKPGWHNHEESIGNTRRRFVGRAGGIFLYRRQHLGYFIGRKFTAGVGTANVAAPGTIGRGPPTVCCRYSGWGDGRTNNSGFDRSRHA